MMSSDPPSDAHDTDDSDCSPVKIRPIIGLGRPSSGFAIGRSTSLDILASSRGTLLHPLPSYPARSVSGPSTTLDQFSLCSGGPHPNKRPPPPPSHLDSMSKPPTTTSATFLSVTETASKRVKLERQGSWSTLSLNIKHRDSFSRSQSQSQIETISNLRYTTVSPSDSSRSSSTSSNIPTPQSKGSPTPAAFYDGGKIMGSAVIVGGGDDQNSKGKKKKTVEEEAEILNAAKGLLELFGGAA